MHWVQNKSTNVLYLKVRCLNRDNLGKSITLSKNVVPGDILGLNNLEIKAPGQGLSPKYLKNLIGKEIGVSKIKGEFVYLTDLGETR